MKRAGGTLTNQAKHSRNQEPQPVTSKGKPSKTKTLHAQRPSHDDRMTAPSASKSQIPPTMELPGPPKGSGYSAVNIATRFIETFDKQYVNFINDFASDFLINLPKLPQEKIFVRKFIPQHSDREIKTRHAGLILGDQNCNGTWEIASWVSNTIKSLTNSPKTKDTESILLEFGVSPERHQDILQKLAGLTDHLDYLHEVRCYHRFFLASHDKLTGPPEKWDAFIAAICLSILSRLKKNRSVLLPGDFRCLTYDQTSEASHATTVIISKLEAGQGHKIHHFETNGHRAIPISRAHADRIRRLDEDPAQEIQRHWTFSPQKVIASGEQNAVSSQDSPKLLLRKTVYQNFDIHPKSLEENVINQINTKILTLAQLIFLNHTAAISDPDTLLDEQYARLKATDISPGFDVAFERQRIHAPQSTNSCELKSTTVACCFLLQDELAYQSLIGLLVKSARDDYSGQHDLRYHPITSKLENELNVTLDDVKRRIALAGAPIEQPY